MNQTLSREQTQALDEIGRQVDDLNLPDLKPLALVLNAERERIRAAAADTQRQMHAKRTLAVTSFTQLLLCARQDLPLTHTNYFDAVAELRELTHE